MEVALSTVTFEYPGTGEGECIGRDPERNVITYNVHKLQYKKLNWTERTSNTHHSLILTQLT